MPEDSQSTPLTLREQYALAVRVFGESNVFGCRRNKAPIQARGRPPSDMKTKVQMWSADLRELMSNGHDDQVYVLGACPGLSGLGVVDHDPDPDTEAQLEVLMAHSVATLGPPVVTSRTGASHAWGVHAWYWTAEPPRNAAWTLPDGVKGGELRGANGYVCLWDVAALEPLAAGAPADAALVPLAQWDKLGRAKTQAKTRPRGKRAKAQAKAGEDEPPPPESEFEPEAGPPPERKPDGRSKLERLARAVENAPPGRRNHTLFVAVVQLLESGYEEDRIRARLTMAWTACEQGGESIGARAREFDSTVESAIRTFERKRTEPGAEVSPPAQGDYLLGESDAAVWYREHHPGGQDWRWIADVEVWREWSDAVGWQQPTERSMLDEIRVAVQTRLFRVVRGVFTLDLTKTQSSGTPAGVQKLFRELPGVRTVLTQWDRADARVVSCGDGHAIDVDRLRDGMVMRKICREDLLEKRLRGRPGATGRDLVDGFTRDVFPIEGEREYTLDWFAAALVLHPVERRALVLYGPTATGKSTWLGAVHHAFGSYAVHLPVSLMFVRGRTPTSEFSVDRNIGRLAGARLALLGDVPEKAELEDGVFKRLTGETTLMGRVGNEFVEVEWRGGLVWACNKLPDRLPPECQRRIALAQATTMHGPGSRRQPDVRLSEKLMAAYPAVLRMLLERVPRIETEGMSPLPGETLELLASAEPRGDHFARFVGDRCVLDEHRFIPCAEFFTEYEEWANRHEVPHDKRVARLRVKARLVSPYGVHSRATRLPDGRVAKCYHGMGWKT